MGLIIGDDDPEGALVEFRKSLAIRQTLVNENPRDASMFRELSDTHKLIGDVLYTQFKLAEALIAYQQSVADNAQSLSLRESFGERSAYVSKRRLVARVLSESRRYEEALILYQELEQLALPQAKASPGNSEAQWNLAMARGDVADILAKQGKLALATQSYQAALSLTKSDVYLHFNSEWKQSAAIQYLRLGRLLVAQRNASAASKAFGMCESLLDDVGHSASDKYDAACCSALAGNKDNAFRYLELALESRWFNTISLENQPDFKSLRNDSRWNWLLARMARKKP